MKLRPGVEDDRDGKDNERQVGLQSIVLEVVKKFNVELQKSQVKN